MHRFRKKSDVKQSPSLGQAFQHTGDRLSGASSLAASTSDVALPELPTTSDFRTSLILPDLSRRFSLLRNSQGELPPWEDLKTKFADQRARGVPHQISEEEEDMLFDTLGKFRPRSDAENTRTQAESPNKGFMSRRYNNLFGSSSSFRDNNYIRSVTSQRSAQSITDSTQSNSTYSESLRPVTPEESSVVSSVQSSPAPSKPPSEQGSPLSMAEYRLAKALGPNGVKRASLALQQAMKEIEEEVEVEEEILMPRRPASRLNHDTKDTNGAISRVSSVYEAGTAISADMPISQEDSPRASPSPVPTQTISGYIPGMLRPMTPHMSIDIDEQRSHSTTPRATSPTSSPYKRDSDNPPRSPPPGSSFFISRPANGRFTPDDSGRDTFSTDPDSADGGSIFGRRRPASPLATNGFQPLTANPSSRPSTPSNVIWNPNPTPNKHTRDASWISDFAAASDISLTSGIDKSKPATRSLRSPALPDSPLMEGADSVGIHKAFEMDNRPISPLSPYELGVQAQVPLSRLLRSPTPTQEQQRSPASLVYPQASSTLEMRNDSRQNSFTLPQFNFGSLNTIAFSPTANSSRSSLASEGSSYHSWEGEDRRNRPPSIFDETDPNKQPWHALASFDKSSTSQTSVDELSQAEETLKQFAGLTKEDIATIQSKLTADAMTKLNAQRERINSLRKRRPSTSQSVYPSPSRVASPPPRNAPSPSPLQAPLQAPSQAPLQASTAEVQPIANVVNTSPAAPVPQPPPGIVLPPQISLTPSQRTRELAKALFGSEDEGGDQPTDSEVPEQDDVLTVGHSAPVEALSPPTPPTPPSPPKSPTPPNPAPSSSPGKVSPSPPKEATNVLDDIAARAKLTMEVQRKTAEANAKYGSSHTHKKVALHQISSPTMVASSTSVNTIPLPYSPSPVSNSPFSPPGTPLPNPPQVTSPSSSSKFGSRIKRLRGTLRSKQAPTGEEVTPFPFVNGPAPIHTADANKLHPMSAHGVPMSALEGKRSKESVPSPPASAGPGLRGFMARLRGKQRASEHAQRAQSPQTSTNGSISPSTKQPSLSSNSEHPSLRGPFQRQPISPQLLRLGAISPISPLSSPTTGEFSDLKTNSSAGEEEAFQKFRDAAATIGLNDNDINDILIRKASVSKGGANLVTLSRNNTLTNATITERKVESPTPSTVDTPFTPTMRKLSIKGKKREPRSGANAVVRRTIIFPSDSRTSVLDLNNIVGRKPSSSRKKRSSVQSNRSIQDRVPTPPPPRSSTTKRFSSEASPPVPQLPQSASVPEGARTQGHSAAEDSSHDSFYDMYTSESGNPEIRANGGAGDQMGPALEVVELANGETIWQIINGLRDDDAESQYHRSSFDSEYSTGEGMQVYFKERRGSTTSSVAPRKKNVVRPETKVFYSSAAHIGKLIENLSTGLEAGSFNFQPASPTKSSITTATGSHISSIGSSLCETDSQWTVEDRIEHMMGSVHGNRR